MSVLPSRSSVEGMTKEEIAAACHTTLVHVFTGILIAKSVEMGCMPSQNLLWLMKEMPLK